MPHLSYKDIQLPFAGRRALVVQRFLLDIRTDAQKRAAKIEATLNASQGTHKKLSRAKADAFFQRLQHDGDRRKKARYLQCYIANDRLQYCLRQPGNI